MNLKRRIKIALVAGEFSGDLLGAELINALKERYDCLDFVGIGGPKMQEAGLHSLVDMERLAVMGFADVLWRYRELYAIRKKLYQQWTSSPPDVFIGIDYPNFNLSLAARLKRHHIKTVHFISPKVWAWRQNRVFYIKKAIDLMLTLFPFEAAFYQKHQVPVQFVGHPLADTISLKVDSLQAKQQLGYKAEQELITVLPGSRMGEIKYMAPLFLDTMHLIALKRPNVCFIVPMASVKLQRLFEMVQANKGYRLNIRLINGQSHQAMAAANVVLTKSGTATLEALLLKRPMVVAYRCSSITHAIHMALLKVPFISLPNLLANQRIVPEYLQGKAQAQVLAKEMINLLTAANHYQLNKQFTLIHETLRQNASKDSARAIMNFLKIEL